MSFSASDVDAIVDATAVDIASNIASVNRRMDDAISSNDCPIGSVRLVAVSKTKPIELLQAAYEVSRRDETIHQIMQGIIMIHNQQHTIIG